MNVTQLNHIGQLVSELGWIPDNELEGMLAASQESGQPLGRILLQRSYISKTELRNLLEAQALIRDNYIDIDYAKRAITFSSWYGMSLENAIPWVIPGEVVGRINYNRRLGQLLVNAGCVDLETLEHSLTVSHQVGVQLGELLVDRQHLSQNMLEVTLESQKLLRSGFISDRQACMGLENINRGLQRVNVPSQKIIVPLGQLLVNSGILSRKNVDDALEVSRINGKPLGEVLKIFALLNDGILESALHLQRLIHDGSLKFAGASQALQHVYETNVPVQEALAHVHDISSKNSGLTIAEFLLLTGLFDRYMEEIEFIAGSGLSNKEQLPLISEYIGDDAVRYAVRSTFFVKHSIISMEQALIAFHLSFLTELDIDDFLQAVGWVTENTMNTIITRHQAQKIMEIDFAA